MGDGITNVTPLTEGWSHWVRAAAAGLTFRRLGEADLPFLRRVYASTRVEELAATGWSAARVETFLDMQFLAQHSYYGVHYPAMDRLLIRADGTEAGRLYLDRGEAEHRVVDIALLPEYRGRGFGAALLRDLLDEAADADRSVTIHVEKFNPAMRLYRRLGFVRVEDKGVYDLMRWATNDQVEADRADTDQVKTAS